MTAHRLFLSVLVLSLAPAAVLAASAQKAALLFTESEAQELRVLDDDWDPVPRARSASLGPVILIHIPLVKLIDGGETLETSSPTHMKVAFEANQAPVDMSSLQVNARKGILSKSLTERLKPFLDGTTLTVEGLEVPSGKFQIQIAVKDLEGNETKRTYRLIVED